MRRNEAEDESDGFGKGKRRIRPPKSLTDIYYMGKKKPVIKKKRLNKTDGFDLKCSVPGCSSKFKTAEVLLLHQQCHTEPKERKMLDNKTSDGQDAVFACPHCPQRYTQIRFFCSFREAQNAEVK